MQRLKSILIKARLKKPRYFLIISAVALIYIFFYGLYTYNELVDVEHLLHISHGRLIAETERNQIVNMNCWSAVSMYSEIEGRIQDHLISLHKLTKSHGRHAEIVKNEELEIITLIGELDALIEKYPDLKSKGPYVYLMDIIKESGLRVITARLNYNQWTYNYNLMCLLFPHKVVAWALGFKTQPFLQGPLKYNS